MPFEPRNQPREPKPGKNLSIFCRCNTEERKLIEDEANRLGISMSDFMRICVQKYFE